MAENTPEGANHPFPANRPSARLVVALEIWTLSQALSSKEEDAGGCTGWPHKNGEEAAENVLD